MKYLSVKHSILCFMNATTIYVTCEADSEYMNVISLCCAALHVCNCFHCDKQRPDSGKR